VQMGVADLEGVGPETGNKVFEKSAHGLCWLESECGAQRRDPGC